MKKWYDTVSRFNMQVSVNVVHFKQTLSELLKKIKITELIHPLNLQRNFV